ncbi:aminodeoxychorismate lyase [Parahaliea aestuarii]|uniref:aminodeoxychorismate lyase n=1 Tax=Parahaliea aestuarii TaxID=1852021 RepID=UPI001650AF01|nr:aminodeoxychorismate lyase [Parahaliea aestuarii]
MTADPCWVDGERSSQLPLPDRGLAFGDGVFETLLLVNGAAMLLAYHEERLQSGLERLGIAATRPLLAATVEQAAGESPAGYAALRVTVTRGTGPRGYAPPPAPSARVIVQLSPLQHDPYAWREPLAIDYSSVRLGRQPQLAGIKHLNRLEQVLAAAECAREGWGEALMLDESGRVVSAVAGNLFLVRGGDLLTPALDGCGVAGTRRRAVIERWAPALGLAVEECAIDGEVVQQADEVFICNSLQGLRAVGVCRKRRWSDFPVTRALLDVARQEMDGMVQA